MASAHKFSNLPINVNNEFSKWTYGSLYCDYLEILDYANVFQIQQNEKDDEQDVSPRLASETSIFFSNIKSVMYDESRLSAWI